MLRFLPVAFLSLGLTSQQFVASAGRGPATVLPPGAYTALAFGDCDGDGDTDVLVNDTLANLCAVLRQGPARTWTTIGLLPGVVTAAAWADFDGDGDLDLLLGGPQFGIMRNDGATFTWRGAPATALSGLTRRVAVGDVDGDGLPDVVVGLSTGAQLLRNQGNTTLGAAVLLTTQPNARPVLFDRDGDGDLDLVVATPQRVLLFDNTNGVMTDVSNLLPTGVVGNDVAAGDFDGDGRVDVALARAGDVDVLWNQPGGFVLAASVGSNGDPVLELAAGDLDRDGRSDLVVRRALAVDRLQATGSRVFVTHPWLGRSTSGQTSAMAFGDLAGRGVLDLVCAWSDRRVDVLYASSPQPVQDPLPGPETLWVGSAAVPSIGDVDGDGRPDLVVAGAQLMHNEGRGHFAVRRIEGARSGYTASWLADLDGDGDLDLVLGPNAVGQFSTVPMQRFTNLGGGQFVPVQDVLVQEQCDSFAFGDIDGDGDVDMLAVTTGNAVKWFQNTGGGTLIDAGALPNVQANPNVTNGIVLADLDGDGDLDLVTGDFNGNVQVHQNNGSGVFVAAASLPMRPGLVVTELAVVDLDGDGRLDIAVREAHALAWFRNQGAFAFSRVAGAFPSGPDFYTLVFPDLDDDGDLDLFPGGTSLTMLTNDGTGRFTDASSQVGVPGFGFTRFLDADEDGDADLFYSTGGTWWIAPNRQRGAESQQVVRPGGACTVRFQVQPQAPAPGAVVLPLAAFAPGPSVAIPGLAGRLLLPAGALLVLGLQSAAAGSATMSFPVPAQPTLIGLDLCVQGLVCGTGVVAGFTNVVDERILP